MSLRGLGVVAIFMSVLVALGGVAHAKPMDPVDDDWDYVEEAMALVGGSDAYAQGPPYVGQSFIDANFFFGSTMQATRGFGAPGDPFADLRCTDINEGACATANQVLVTVVLPACSSTRTRDCIESFYVNRDGVVTEGTVVGEWVGEGSFDFDAVPTAIGPTPESGRLPLYQLAAAPHSAGDIYAASVQIDIQLTRKDSGWSALGSELGAQIYPVSKVPAVGVTGPCGNAATIGKGPDAGTCLQSGNRLPDEVLGIRARVSPTFGSWVFGRVTEPQITIASAGDQISLDVSGRPAVTPQSLGMVPAAEATPDMYLWMRPYERGVRMVSFKAGQPGSLGLWSAWNAVTKSTSSALKRLWIFRSSSEGSFGAANCIKSGRVAGWISTNAMVYEATPPAYNSSTGALDFKIGGPAYQTDGKTPVSADYELFLRSDVASCIWPGQRVASVATVSVIDGAGGEEATATSVSESGGWVKFIARNVLFPAPPGSRARAAAANPTIRVVVPMSATGETFASCTALRKKYKDGVTFTGAINTVTVKGKKVIKPALGKPFISDAVYTANASLDTDKDKLVCEREPKAR